MKKNQLIILTLILLISNLVNAQSASGTQTRGSDKVDLKKLEDKYWSAKDDDYGVIQNRTYSKAQKFYGSLVWGTLINDSYAQAKPIGGMLGYYFTEDYGLELSYLSHASKKNDSTDELQKRSTAISPNFNLVKSSMTLSATYTPFYAKMAFMNKAILYFDMGFTLGAGLTTYDQAFSSGVGQPEEYSRKSAPHVELGFMQQLFINKNIAFRMDLKNTFYKQDIRPYQLNSNTVGGAESKTANDTTLTFGATFFTN